MTAHDDEPRTPACDACPLGFLAGVVRDAQPEATVHLLAATRELLLALETVVRAAEQQLDQRTEPAGTAPEAQPRVRRIDIA
jgi:hypothetical protein